MKKAANKGINMSIDKFEKMDVEEIRKLFAHVNIADNLLKRFSAEELRTMSEDEIEKLCQPEVVDAAVIVGLCICFSNEDSNRKVH